MREITASNFNKAKIYQLPITVNRVILPLDYGYAGTGDLLVTSGQYVNQNQALTKTIYNNHMAIALHAPINGLISNIGDYPVLQALYKNSKNQSLNKTIKAIEINNEINNEITTENTSHTNLNRKNHVINNPHDFINTLSNYGIIGLGGAGFPSAEKLSNKNITTIVVNAVECESPIAVDNCLIINNCKEIINGLLLLAKIFNTRNIIIAIKDTMIVAIDVLKQKIKNYSLNDINVDLKIYQVPDQYPNGYSKTLINLITNYNIPNNQHSTDYGVICFNIATVYAIEQAINENKPLTERIVTITGDISKQGNYLLPIGTPISTLLKAFMIDLNLVKDHKKNLAIKIGGDYMGYEIFNSEYSNQIENYYNLDNIGIDKTTQAIAISYQDTHKQNHIHKNITHTIKDKLSQWLSHLHNDSKQQACIKCNLCETVCPVNLKPQQLYWFSNNFDHNNNQDIIKSYNINQCIECGLCDNVCPSNIPLAAKFKHIKSKLKISAKEEYDSRLAEARNKLHNCKLNFKKAQKDQILTSRSKTKKELLASVLSKAKKKHD